MDHRFLHYLHTINLYCVRILALLMVVVIIAGTLDVGYIVYNNLIFEQPYGLLHVENIVGILGAFLAVLISIEIYTNIIIYLKEDTINLKLVLATALIAISRKVIVLDYKTTSPEYIYATGVVILATAAAYWIVNPHKKTLKDPEAND